MKKTITPFTAQLVSFETTLPYEQVIARLDAEVNKTGSAKLMPNLKEISSRQDLVDLVKGITGGNDFLYFMEMAHHKWINTYQEAEHPPAVVYTIGNPLIAETFMRHDIRSGYSIPPRLLITEIADRSGTTVIYHLPSSLIISQDHVELMKAVRVLDEKLERMITRVTTDEDS